MTTSGKSGSTSPSSLLFQDFHKRKEQCLGKRDKSFAGRIDVRAVEICSVINDKQEFYTTSSCSGRAFLYQGKGIKARDGTGGVFRRFRIAHDVIADPPRYFDLKTFESDPTGGGDPIRTVGQFEHAEKVRELQKREGALAEKQPLGDVRSDSEPMDDATIDDGTAASKSSPSVIWLRYEPFILHVCCRSLTAASKLMAAARPAFKNVGLTSWNSDKAYYLIAIWGDEGLDMPLCNRSGESVFDSSQREWLTELVNDRHERNWKKIDRFVKAVREMGDVEDEADMWYSDQVGLMGGCDITSSSRTTVLRKSFDAIGDVAVLHTMPSGDNEERTRVGEAIMRKNRALKVCAVRTSALEGTERAAQMTVIAGSQRSPLVTSHSEYGIRCVVDLNSTFFSPRMGPERLRICQQVARGENVLVLFAGVGMEALQIAGRTEASSVVAIELNPVAVECARRGHRMLERNKGVKCVGAADRLQIIEGDVLDVLPTMKKGSIDRILAPRPKEGALDGDLGMGDGGSPFLDALLPLLKEEGGECHWYDFAAQTEFPLCDRSRGTILRACRNRGLKAPKVINAIRAGSVAKRQLRVCIDFKLCGRDSS